MRGLTEKQKNIMSFIEEFMRTMEMAPTIYEIAEHFHIKTSTVFAHIRALQKKGFLKRSSKARSISLNKTKKKGRTPHGIQAIPVIGADSQTNSELFCDSKLLSKASSSKDLFAIKVKGTSMKNMGILDGDFVILKNTPADLNRGDIVLTDMNGEPVLRSCFPIDSEIIELRTANADDQPLVGKKSELPLKGVVVGLQRSIAGI